MSGGTYDGSRIISVGVSAGGFATVALTADPPPGLIAAISFAGGRGSLEADQDCRADRLVDAYRAMGKTSRVPMLWVYAENDHFFGPQLAQQLRQAFTGSGGNVEFIRAPAFRDEGHFLFSQAASRCGATTSIYFEGTQSRSAHRAATAACTARSSCAFGIGQEWCRGLSVVFGQSAS